jgi:chromosome segregation ATPase
MQELLSRSGDSHATELGRYEDALRERAHALRELEAEVARRERIVRELVGALEEAAAPAVGVSAAAAAPTAISATADALAAANEAANAAAARAAAATQALGEASAENARLRRQLDALALEVARREGEAQATMWTVSELERRLSANDAPPARGEESATAAKADAGDLGAALVAAQDQLDALRQALAQEHEARVRAESGEELTRARAEIRRLETLIPG